MNQSARTVVLAAGLLFAGAAACLDVNVKDGVLPCGAGGACPTPYRCASDNRCYRALPVDAGGGTDTRADGGGSDGTAGDGGAGDGGVDAPTCTGVDFANDMSNCGRCGHSCLGGSCEQSLCQPARIGTISDTLSNIATNSTTLFVAGAADSTSKMIPIYSVSKLATNGTLATATAIPGPNGGGFGTFVNALAADDTIMVVNAEEGGVGGFNLSSFSCVPSNCAATTQPLFSMVNRLGIAAIDLAARKVFFQTPDATTMQFVPLDPPNTPQHFSPELNMPSVSTGTIAAARGYIYVTSAVPTFSGSTISNHVLERAASDGSTLSTTLANRGTDASATLSGPIYVTADAVFMLGPVPNATDNGQLIFRVPLPNGVGGGVPATLPNAPPIASANFGFPSYFADDGGVFWIDVNNQVVTCPAAGCPTATPQVLANAGVAGGLTGDAAALYWWVQAQDPNDATKTISTVMRLAR